MLTQTLDQFYPGVATKRMSPTPTPLSPTAMMSSHPQRTASTDSTADGIRKRVCKACDRCRMKKSKCDGSHPCSRCKADNAICVFGERKKSHDKVYPKGYVEMLEQQQGQLVSGLQELYRRSLAGKSWSGPVLSEATGHPLTHDILSALHLLEAKTDGSNEMEAFEEDCEKLQSKLVASGAGYVRRRDSFSSDSDHSQHGVVKPASRGTPANTKAPVFDKNFTFTPSPSPLAQSPVPRHRQSYPPAQQSPLHRLPPTNNNDPQFFQAEWATTAFNGAGDYLRTKYALQTPQLQDLDELSDAIENQWNDPQIQYGTPYSANNEYITYPQQLAAVFPGMQTLPEYNNGADGGMEMDFQSFIQVG